MISGKYIKAIIALFNRFIVKNNEVEITIITIV